MASQRMALVVGLGGGGIGDHCAKRFARGGYRVAMVSRTKENLDRLEKEIPNSKGFVCDASKSDEIKSMVNSLVSDGDFNPGKRIDVLIFNAGSGSFKNFNDVSEEDFKKSLATGPEGLFSFAKAVLPVMQSQSVIDGADGMLPDGVRRRKLLSTLFE
jgi:NAD(P)-dependent dehydrogenase (short-subunit alcohol dehydrogenase family)